MKKSLKIANRNVDTPFHYWLWTFSYIKSPFRTPLSAMANSVEKEPDQKRCCRDRPRATFGSRSKPRECFTIDAITSGFIASASSYRRRRQLAAILAAFIAGRDNFSVVRLIVDDTSRENKRGIELNSKKFEFEISLFSSLSISRIIVRFACETTYVLYIGSFNRI